MTKPTFHQTQIVMLAQRAVIFPIPQLHIYKGAELLMTSHGHIRAKSLVSYGLSQASKCHICWTAWSVKESYKTKNRLTDSIKLCYGGPRKNKCVNANDRLHHICNFLFFPQFHFNCHYYAMLHQVRVLEWIWHHLVAYVEKRLS